MKTGKILGMSFAVVLVAIVSLEIFGEKKETVAVEAERATAPAKAIPTPPPQLQEIQAAETNPQILLAQPKVQPAAPLEKVAVQNPRPSSPASPANGKKPLQDPAARVALSLVGMDSDAEAYWLGAIFDPSLPDQEREDLMEDLNEDGFADPKHPSVQEIPLILNRMAFIEQIAPAADPFMQEHLGEAYKDLNNMLAGEPVQ